ncbi:7TM-DISM domain-containing protein [Aliamphritea spongicola]
MWSKGQHQARGYTLAWSIWSITVICGILRFQGIIPTSNFAIGATRFGMILETILLAFALVDRVNILRKENSPQKNGSDSLPSRPPISWKAKSENGPGSWSWHASMPKNWLVWTHCPGYSTGGHSSSRAILKFTGHSVTIRHSPS